MGPLTGKTALVTGASRGIGRAIAERLGSDGAHVAVHYGSNRASAEQVVERIVAEGGRAFAVGTDLAAPDAAEQLWKAFDAGLAQQRDDGTADIEDTVPGPDILVNNAGIALLRTVEATTPEEYDRLFAVNTRAPFHLLRLGLDRITDGGRIINISTGVTRSAYPELTAYAMTKAALENLTLHLAEALGPRGITVNCVSPGVVDTDMNAGWLRGNADVEAGMAAQAALGRLGTPADVADVVALVASDDARFLTGQILDASGGTGL